MQQNQNLGTYLPSGFLIYINSLSNPESTEAHELSHFYQDILSLNGLLTFLNSSRLINLVKLKLASIEERITLSKITKIIQEDSLYHQIQDLASLTGVKSAECDKLLNQVESWKLNRYVREINLQGDPGPLRAYDIYTKFNNGEVEVLPLDAFVIKEGISHLHQEIFDLHDENDCKHYFWPYRVVEFIIGKTFKIEKLEDKKKLLILFFISLMDHNPMYRLFALLPLYNEFDDTKKLFFAAFEKIRSKKLFNDYKDGIKEIRKKVIHLIKDKAYKNSLINYCNALDCVKKIWLNNPEKIYDCLLDKKKFVTFYSDELKFSPIIKDAEANLHPEFDKADNLIIPAVLQVAGILSGVFKEWDICPMTNSCTKSSKDSCKNPFELKPDDNGRYCPYGHAWNWLVT